MVVYTPAELMVEEGTTGILKCTIRSSEVISSRVPVSWTFLRRGQTLLQSTFWTILLEGLTFTSLPSLREG
ncbi:hypothetical protein AAFF_G00440010 [Aldrovandia affinis]|uniref:Ig-like domain-containing protein n=1 Tax=Aldrovandia affinis TaxID=143900 RepID=A0AAD7VYA8_9TELE|nr:hypothetical protein AAFF_G00440010 [Aldrovandia affinis]